MVVVYDSQTKTREITDSEQDLFYLKLCKGIVHNEKDRLGRLVMTDPAAAESVLKYMNKTVSEEVRTLTSKKHNSYLQQIDCQSLMTFKWKTFEDELKVNAPLFFKLLSAACDKSDILPAPVLFSVATILRSRNPKMSAAHHIVALMLDDGGCKDKVRWQVKGHRAS